MELQRVILIIAYIIGACVWLYSMDVAFEQKYKKKFYTTYIIFDIMMELLNEFTVVGEVTNGLPFTILTFAYTASFICIMYNGKTHRKLLHVGVLFLMSLVCDFVTVVCFVASGASMKQMSEEGMYNSIATILSKVLLYLLIKFVYRKIRIDNIVMPIVYLMIILELPSIVLFKTETKFLIVYVISQAAALAVAVYIVKIFKNKKEERMELEEKAIKYRSRAVELEEEARKLEEKAKKFEMRAIELEEQMKNSDYSMIEFYENRKKILVDSEEIVFAERVGRKVVIKTLSGEHEINITIQNLCEKLGRRFIRINQGTIVNQKYIKKIEGETLLCMDIEFMVSRRKTGLVKDILQERK